MISNEKEIISQISIFNEKVINIFIKVKIEELILFSNKIF